jgi:N-acyl-D-amino-acid deacylase
LHDRGLLRKGYAADIVIFDEKEVKDISTFEKPHAYSKGFHYVIVNGTLTVDKENHNGSRAGKALYGPGLR